ncbi:MAG: hypothetical protein ACRYG4_05650 [Janthinobacterium lividum]
MIRAAGTWGALIVLLALNIGLALLPLGRFALPLMLAIAATMAVPVLTIFMDLGRSSGLIRAFAAAGFVWLLILVGLSSTDYSTRNDVLLPRPEPAARDWGAK